jgi:hypothetical protein
LGENPWPCGLDNNSACIITFLKVSPWSFDPSWFRFDGFSDKPWLILYLFIYL